MSLLFLSASTLTVQVFGRLVLQGPGSQAPLNGGTTGAYGQGHGGAFLLQSKVEPASRGKKNSRSGYETAVTPFLTISNHLQMWFDLSGKRSKCLSAIKRVFK